MGVGPLPEEIRCSLTFIYLVFPGKSNYVRDNPCVIWVGPIVHKIHSNCNICGEIYGLQWIEIWRRSIYKLNTITMCFFYILALLFFNVLKYLYCENCIIVFIELQRNNRWKNKWRWVEKCIHSVPCCFQDTDSNWENIEAGRHIVANEFSLSSTSLLSGSDKIGQ